MAEEPPRGSYAIKYVCMYVLIFTNGLENSEDQKLVGLQENISIWELNI